MLKKELFLAAMAADEFKRRAWVISAFSLINEGVDDWKKKPYPYRVVQTPAGHFYVNPDNTTQLLPIDDAVAGQSIYSVKEKVLITANEVLGVSEDMETTYGRLLFNYVAIIHPFKGKLPYLNKRVDPSEVEGLIIKRLKDTPKDTVDRIDEDIYVDEYLVFCDAMFFLTGFTQICVPAASKKTMTAAPGIEELKNRLIEENKDRLYDPAVIAKIDAELVAYDRAYLKGDSAEGFLIKDKLFDIVRKKLFSMHGAETGLDEGLSVDLIQNSLSQGWDVSRFPAMNNSSRAGSFNRGAMTMLGGESVKWLLRTSSNMSVTEDDCGATLGILFDINETNYTKLIGFHVIEDNNTILITDKDLASKYVNKKVMVRSPMFCKLTKTDYCKKCVGENLAAHPTGLSVAISDFGSAMLDIFMKMMHGKKLSLAKLDYKASIF